MQNAHKVAVESIVCHYLGKVYRCTQPDGQEMRTKSCTEKVELFLFFSDLHAKVNHYTCSSTIGLNQTHAFIVDKKDRAIYDLGGRPGSLTKQVSIFEGNILTN